MDAVEIGEPMFDCVRKIELDITDYKFPYLCYSGIMVATIIVSAFLLTGDHRRKEKRTQGKKGKEENEKEGKRPEETMVEEMEKNEMKNKKGTWKEDITW